MRCFEPSAASNLMSKVPGWMVAVREPDVRVVPLPSSEILASTLGLPAG